MRVVQEN